MGLDNGLIMKKKTQKGENFLKIYCSRLEETYAPGCFEFGYWRKCWNIRQRFLDVFKDKYNNDDYAIYLTIEDIPVIVEKVLKFFLDENNWEYDGHTSQVFTWYEELPSIAQSIRNLMEFYEDWRADDELKINNEDIEFYFYDSY